MYTVHIVYVDLRTVNHDVAQGDAPGNQGGEVDIALEGINAQQGVSRRRHIGTDGTQALHRRGDNLQTINMYPREGRTAMQA